MASTQASYRNPQPTLTPNEFAQLSALERDLEALCAEGMLEAFVDDRGVTRYKPLELAKAV